jgi:molybdopterin synthase sulfur carrier subunit
MKIKYFAWLKDKVGLEEEVVTLPADVKTVGMLVDWLSKRGQNYETAFEFIEVVKVAVNQACVDNTHPVNNNDEVIFFPPIAGG